MFHGRSILIKKILLARDRYKIQRRGEDRIDRTEIEFLRRTRFFKKETKKEMKFFTLFNFIDSISQRGYDYDDIFKR